MLVGTYLQLGSRFVGSHLCTYALASLSSDEEKQNLYSTSFIQLSIVAFKYFFITWLEIQVPCGANGS